MKVGSKVVYIEKDVPGIGLINGKIYTIRNIADCGTKGHPFSIDVGLNIPLNHWGVICEDCGNIISIGPEYYVDSTAFRELDEFENVEEGTLERKILS